MGRSKLLVLVFVVLGTALTGCVTPRLPTPDGFPTLSVDADNENTLVFTRPDLDLSRYSRIHVEPVRVMLKDGERESAVTDEESRELARFADERITAELAKHFELVDAPGPGVFRLRFTLTGLVPTKAAQAVMLVPPFSTIKLVSPKGAFVGSIAAERIARDLHALRDRNPA